MEKKHPYKILIVEDKEAIRKNYKSYLEMLFLEVYEAKDGEEAYKIYKTEKPEILLVDINIPKLNGLDLIEKIRENDYTTKAIISTAYTDKEFLLKAISLKLTKYLPKPVSRKDLKESLELAIHELEKYKFITLEKINLKEGYYWDMKIKELKNKDTMVNLTSKEKVLLELLLSYKDKVFSYDEIFDYVWGFDDNITLNRLKNIVKRLRKKLPEDTILNIFNEGYKINY